jgi:pimeloyl-[acyl-carrier protein] synthase
MHGTDLPDSQEVDLFGTQVRANPYPFYQRLRAQDPVHWSVRHSAWIITAYDPALYLLSQSGVCHWATGPETTSNREPPDSFGRLLGRWLNLLDPRTHSTLRTLTSEVFAPKPLDELRRAIQHLADNLLDQAEPAGSVEIIQGFADPIALTAMGQMLGIPNESQGHFQRLARGLVGRLYPSVDATTKQEDHPDRFVSFFDDLLQQKRRQPQQDLLSALVRAQSADCFQNEDLTAFLVFFLFAGHENIMNFIGNAVFTLANHPSAFDALRQSQSVPSSAVDELLRYDSPVQFMAVSTREDLPLAGRTLRPGQQILVGIGAANRDPDRFPNPDQLDLARAHNRHLSFGHGPLTCLGASLARLEGQVAIEVIVRRIPRLVLCDPVAWRCNPPVLRGPESLRIRLGIG